MDGDWVNLAANLIRDSQVASSRYKFVATSAAAGMAMHATLFIKA